ncbi:MAG: hypothetical protein HY907_19755 [Deltaproteobacteria bacterium]|nr:hypothetical protein [Deltaproteobacteria bacterium]
MTTRGYQTIRPALSLFAAVAVLAGCEASPLPYPPDIDPLRLALVGDAPGSLTVSGEPGAVREPGLPLRLRNATRPAAPAAVSVAADGSFVAAIDGYLTDVLRFDRGPGDSAVVLHVAHDGASADDVVPVPAPADSDFDGWAVPLDCGDTDPHVFPGAPEVCDGVDNDCDGVLDESLVCSVLPCAADADCEDGLLCDGAETCIGGLCLPGPVPACDDGDPATFDFCDPSLDGCVNVAPSASRCGNGLLESGELCDDGNVAGGDACPADCLACTPSAEACNGRDDDCNGVVDDGLSCPASCVADADCRDDGLFCTSVACEGGFCAVTLGQDCNDGDPATVDDCVEASDTCTHGTCVPAAEICNGIDDDCDGVVDDGCTCVSGETDCGGVCVDLLFDELNCGACGSACSAGQTCLRGSCSAT